MSSPRHKLICFAQYLIRRTNTSVILNVELARHVKDLFCEAKFTLEKNEWHSHQGNGETATLFKVGATIGRPLRMTGYFVTEKDSRGRLSLQKKGETPLVVSPFSNRLAV